MTQAKQYRNKPVIKEAIQLTANNSQSIIEFCEGNAYRITDPVYETQIYIKTLEGDMKVNIGDYVIKGVKGEFYPCKPDIFEATYDLVN